MFVLLVSSGANQSMRLSKRLECRVAGLAVVDIRSHRADRKRAVKRIESFGKGACLKFPADQEFREANITKDSSQKQVI
jgi:hypothetical protein